MLSSVLAVAVLLAFSFGCAGYVSKETKLKCPKCGAVFTVDEAQEFGKKTATGG